MEGVNIEKHKLQKVVSFNALILAWLVISLSIVEAQSITYELTYDEIGNLQQSTDVYLEYNEFNQLKRVRENDQNGQILEEYTYDQDGNRLTKYEPQINQTTHYISDDFIEVHNSTGKYLTVYYRDPQSGTLLGRKDPNGDKFYYHPDHLGSTSLVTDEAGNVVEETSYKPFGGVVSGGESRHLFAGKERDKNTGLDYLIARYYDSGTRLFTQCDKTKPDVYNPQALNCYNYVLNNPYKYVDPEGEFAQLAPLLIPAATIGILSAVYGGYQSFRTQSASGQPISRSKIFKSAGIHGLAGFSGTFVAGAVASSAALGIPIGFAAETALGAGISEKLTSRSIVSPSKNVETTSNLPSVGGTTFSPSNDGIIANREALVERVKESRLNAIERSNNLRRTTPQGNPLVLNQLAIQAFEGDRASLQALYAARINPFVTQNPINLLAARKRIETRGRAFR